MNQPRRRQDGETGRGSTRGRHCRLRRTCVPTDGARYAPKRSIPIQPPPMERTARMTSGPSIDQGLSWPGVRLRGRASVGAGVHWSAVIFEASAAFAEKGQVPEAEHVEGREQRGDEADEPEDLAAGALQECRVEDRVLGEESRRGEGIRQWRKRQPSWSRT